MLRHPDHHESIVQTFDGKSHQPFARIEEKRFSSRTTNINPRNRAAQSQAGSKGILQPNTFPMIGMRNANESIGSTSLSKIGTAYPTDNHRMQNTRNMYNRFNGQTGN